MLEEIDAVDWASLPGRPDRYEPAVVVRGLKALAEAVDLRQVAEARSRLADRGILHGHSAAAFPAAAVAAPLLLDIAQHGPPVARGTALGLLGEALDCYPHAGYTRVTDHDGIAVPLCCAIAHHLRVRRAFLVGLGKAGRSLLADADTHWRFEVRECVADSGDAVAFGILAGRLPDGVHEAETHRAGVIAGLSEVTVEYPLAAGSPESESEAEVESEAEACLRVTGRQPAELPPGTVLLPADCGDRVH
ncbi:hypothetical protein [Streptomyces sp. KL116D]|uniref:hypothetical protein n=1 Tax=Streptomyces sp. KL116D TaxID=3045152 RepID=UPI0035561279